MLRSSLVAFFFILAGARRVPRPVNASSGKIFYQSVLAFTRFNCAFPFCPTVSFNANHPAHQKPTPQKHKPEPQPYHPLNPNQTDRARRLHHG